MANQDSSSEKTEDPTPKKLRDSREQGQVAQSKELTMLSGLAVVMFLLIYNIKNLYDNLNEFIALICLQVTHANLSLVVIGNALFESGSIIIKIIALPIILGVTVSFIINSLQINGIIFIKNGIKLDFNRLNIVSNAKNIYSLKNLIKFARQVIEIIIMGIVATFIIKNNLPQLVNIYYYHLPKIILFLGVLSLKIFVFLISVHFIFTILDFILEKKHLFKQLKMTPSEVKNEMKNTEGHPEIKQERRARHREILEDDYSDTISNSTFLLANPTHIAIVVVYRPQKTKLPVILLKADGERAQEFFKLARKFKVPIFQDKWLARKLYEIAEIGKYVPTSLIAPVANLIGKNLALMPTLSKELHEMASQKVKNIEI